MDTLLDEDQLLAQKFGVLDADPVDTHPIEIGPDDLVNDDVLLSRKDHRGFGKAGGKSFSKKTLQESVVSSEQTPINSVKEVVEKIRVATSSLKQGEQEKALGSYADWVQRSLELGIVDYDANDVKADVNDKLVVMTHKPSTFFGMDSSTEVVAENRKKAEYKLFDRMERHLRDWQNCPNEFRDSTLKNLGAKIKNNLD